MKLLFSVIFRIILFPITLLVRPIIYVRNWLYDKNILKSTQPEIFTINVGNLNLGGTGKTPHVEYLVRLLADKHKTTILSRGYMRRTSGFILANDKATAYTIGDEPMQYYLKFKDKINVAVCENRIEGVQKIRTAALPQPSPREGEFLSPSPSGRAGEGLVILDDAFQHRPIAPHLNLLLCDYNRPFYDDYLVPFGSLRDLRQSAKRADAVIVTKCPKDISFEEYKTIMTGISRYTLPNTPVFFSTIKYKSVVGYSSKSVFKANKTTDIITAIAKPELFIGELYLQGVNINFVRDYPDHYSFSRNDIDKAIEATGNFRKVPQIISTEKDMVKIKPLLNDDELKRFFYLPIEIEMKDKKSFDAFVLEKIKGYRTSVSHTPKR